jgi:hypothetical protein
MGLPRKYADQRGAYGQALWRKIARAPEVEGGRTHFALYRSLVTLYNLTDLRRRPCYTVREIPIEGRFGADVWLNSGSTRRARLRRRALLRRARTPRPRTRRTWR